MIFGWTALCGLAAMGLRLTAMANHVDAKGLLVEGNLPTTLQFLIAVFYGISLIPILMKLGGNGRFRNNFPRCALSGSLAMAGGALMAVMILFFIRPEELWKLALGLAASGSMIFTGYCRFRGRHPNFLFHGIVCVFFIMELMERYRPWSSDPQLTDYAFPLLACVLLMLYSFHRACCDANMIDRKKLAATGLAACFCCLVSLADPLSPGYYAAAGLWAAGSMCNLNTLPADPEEKEQTPEP